MIIFLHFINFHSITVPYIDKFKILRCSGARATSEVVGGHLKCDTDVEVGKYLVKYGNMDELSLFSNDT